MAKRSLILHPDFERGSRNPFLTAENIFDCLHKTYDDLNRRHTTQSQFRKLRQENKGLENFWADVQRLTSELDYNDETLIDELQHKDLHGNATTVGYHG